MQQSKVYIYLLLSTACACAHVRKIIFEGVIFESCEVVGKKKTHKENSRGRKKINRKPAPCMLPLPKKHRSNETNVR